MPAGKKSPKFGPMLSFVRLWLEIVLRTPAYSVRRIISKAFCLSSQTPFNLHSPYRPIVEWASGWSLPSIDCCFWPSIFPVQLAIPFSWTMELHSLYIYIIYLSHSSIRSEQLGKQLDKENSLPRRFFWNKLALKLLTPWLVYRSWKKA